MLQKHTEIHFFVFLKMKIFNPSERYTLFALYGSMSLHLSDCAIIIIAPFIVPLSASIALPLVVCHLRSQHQSSGVLVPTLDAASENNKRSNTICDITANTTLSIKAKPIQLNCSKLLLLLRFSIRRI